MNLPASFYDLVTLEAVLVARGDPVADLYACSGCPRQLPAAGFVSTEGLPGTHPAYLCHTCASGPHREAVAAQEREAIEFAAAQGVHDWSDVRGERNLRLAACDWTQMPDAALSEQKRAEWAAYRTALRDLTVGAPSPADVVWPSAPS